MEPFALVAVASTIVALVTCAFAFEGWGHASTLQMCLLIASAVGMLVPAGVFVALVRMHKRLSRASHERQRLVLRVGMLAMIVGFSVTALAWWLLAR
jgi:hypothetical protein